MEKVFTYLGWIVLLTLMFGIARQLSSQKGIYFLPDSWGLSFALNQREGFEDKKGVIGVIEESEGSSPQSVTAPNAYSILGDVLKTKGKEGTLTAKSCYANDFLAQTEKTGNYIQRTNNFRHATPDSCSAPRTELVNAFYENP